MERITKFFMQRRTLFWSLMVGIILIGVASYVSMPKLEDPAVPVKQVSVIALYPGADTHTVELDVAVPLEDALRTMPDIRKIKTDVMPGKAQITLEFQLTLPSVELEQHFDMVRRKMSDAARSLPQGCMDPVVVDDMMDVYGLFFAFTADGYELPEAEKYAKMLRRELLTVPGVKRINIGGTRGEVINIELTPEQLKRNGLLPTQVMMSLQNATKSINAGTVPSGTTRMSVDVTEGVKDAADVANLLIDTPEGKKVRLGEVAKVERAYAEPARNLFYVNGKPALTFAITLDKSAIVPDVGKAVDAKIAEVAERMPAGMQAEKIFFQPDKVSAAMDSFMLNLLESVVIVVLVLMFSMGWRSGVIIGFGLVLTVALSFPILSVLGTTLQRISLGAFIVAMGMLVDNSVVIMDGILVDRAKGLPPSVYLYRIGKNTAMPLLGATIIAASTFLPIYLTPGSTGEFAGDLFLVICVSLLVSWILALVQVPVCAAQWMGPSPAVTAEVKTEERREGRVNRMIASTLRWLMAHRVISVTTACSLIVLGVVGMGKVRQVFFPDFDYGQFVVECYFPGTNDPTTVEHRILAMADSVKALPDVDRVAVNTTGAPGRYCFVRPMPTGGDNYAEMIIDCRDFKTMQRMTNEVRTLLRNIAPDAYIRTRKYNFSISSSHTVEVEFAGPDPAVLQKLSAQVERMMRGCDLIDPYSVQNNWRPKAPTLTFEFSQQDAERAGVSRGDVGNALQAANEGYAVGAIADGDKVVPINIIMRDADGSRPSSLASIPVWSMANIKIDPEQISGMLAGANSSMDNTIFSTTLLGNVIDSATVRNNYDFIYRYNGQRAIQAECDPDPLNPDATPAKVEAALTDSLAKIVLPQGYTMRFGGEGDTSKESTGMLVGMMPMVCLIICVVLLLLFNNWRKLILICVCFPFVICGITPMLLLTQTPFTFLAILGFMGLIGMMVKNAIVLVDEITRLTGEEHVDPYTAVIQATLSRVRPVLLASFTTILGMIPLIPDAMYGSLAVTVIGGLFVGTLVTLLILPLFYSILFKVKKPA